MQNEDIDSLIRDKFEYQPKEWSGAEVRHMADLFAKLIDYKSVFTESHSTGVATKAEWIAKYYNYPSDKILEFYFAGALHDIGKLAVSTKLLEKNCKLSVDEFDEIKEHADETRHILGYLRGLDSVVEMASNHHEKLNGSGYPRGLKSEDLNKESRILACIDIYQALTEKRPYKDGMSAVDAIKVMSGMASNGEIDSAVVSAIEVVFV